MEKDLIKLRPTLACHNTGFWNSPLVDLPGLPYIGFFNKLANVRQPEFKVGPCCGKPCTLYAILKSIMKLLFALLMCFILHDCFPQKTFHVDTNLLDTLQLINYRTFIASKDLEVDFIGRLISYEKRFTPTKSEAISADNAIQAQYADAAIRQLDKQYSTLRVFSDSVELQKAYDIYQERRPRIIKKSRNDLPKKIEKFDRYMWGYRNEDNDKLILIRFDPHKIKYYTIAGETSIDVLSIMIYDVSRNLLSVAGWSDYKE